MNINLNISKLIILLLIILPINSFSQIGGTSTYKFLDLVNSGRVASLGGNNISLNDSDLNLVYHNPALLTSVSDNSMVLNYVSYFADINWGYVAYAKDYGKIGTFATGIHYVNYGTFTRADEVGNKLGEFKAAEYALNLFWSKKIDSLWTFGANLKPVYSKLESYYSIGLVADFGLNYYKSKNGFSASLVLRNFGTQLKPYNKGNYEKCPTDLQIGFSKKLLHAPFRFSITAQHLQKLDLGYEIPSTNLVLIDDKKITKRDVVKKYSEMGFRHAILGLEFIPTKNFIISFGYNHQRHQEMKLQSKSGFSGFSWGVSINTKKFNFAYGRASYHVAGSSNLFSIQINLNQFYTKIK